MPSPQTPPFSCGFCRVPASHEVRIPAGTLLDGTLDGTIALSTCEYHFLKLLTGLLEEWARQEDTEAVGIILVPLQPLEAGKSKVPNYSGGPWQE